MTEVTKTGSVKCKDTCGECYYSEPKHRKPEWMFCYLNPPLQPKKDKDSYYPEVKNTNRACSGFKRASAMEPRTPNQRA